VASYAASYHGCHIYLSPVSPEKADGKSVNRELPVSDQARVRPELSIPAAGQKDRGHGDENEYFSVVLFRQKL